MLKKIAVAVAAAIILLIAFVATRPGSFTIERSIVIGAPPSTVFAHVSDFGRWNGWSPWDKLDPAMKRTLSGTPGTIGHAYSWSGNKKVGEGRMTLTGLTRDERVEIRLEFLEPWQATNMTVLALRPDGSGSRITWSMTGTNNFMMKAVGLFMNMDKMVGGDFERGLQSLKGIAEAEVAKAARD
jgi:uncharacterized protein YndB with AHSA1/START domain